MGLWQRLLAALAVAARMGGCDLRIARLKPGVSTARDVRGVLGEPTYEWQEADGVVVWEFAGPRAGYVTYLVTIGPDRVMRALEQVLAEEYLDRKSTRLNSSHMSESRMPSSA